MATYYLSPHGNDADNGLGPDPTHATNKPWLTFGKALGAAGIASGDTVYICPGVYRETVTLAMTSATAETFVIGDTGNAQGFKDGSGGHVAGGVVRLTAYTTNDKTAPAAATLLSLNSRDFLTFRNLHLSGGDAAPSTVNSTTATDIKFTNCIFVSPRSAAILCTLGISANVAANWTFDSCVLIGGAASSISVTMPTSASADYDVNVQVKNCLLLFGTNTILAGASGALSFKGGGIDVYNSTFVGGTVALNANSANVSTGIPCTFYNNVCYLQTTNCLTANTTGQIIEDYCLLFAGTPRSNVTAGANSISGSPSPHAPLFDFLASAMFGLAPRPFFGPMLVGPALGFGNQAGGPTVDLLGYPRPSGPGPTWANALRAIGCHEYPNSGAKETTTVRTGTSSLRFTGPGMQDFDLAVPAEVTTISVYARYDSTYAGTLPTMAILDGDECGVSDASDVMVAAVDTWEQLSLTFTPARAGRITVRLQSSSTAGGGKAFFDDFAVV